MLVQRGYGGIYFTELRVIAGKPKILAGNDIAQSDRFLLSYDFSPTVDGSGWTGDHAEGDTQIGSFPGLGELDGVPAYMFVDLDGGALHLVRATNSDGGAWAASETVLTNLEGISGHIEVMEVQGLAAFTAYARPGGGGGRKLRYGVYYE